jgi:hypothetical protein
VGVRAVGFELRSSVARRRAVRNREAVSRVPSSAWFGSLFMKLLFLVHDAKALKHQSQFPPQRHKADSVADCFDIPLSLEVSSEVRVRYRSSACGKMRGRRSPTTDLPRLQQPQKTGHSSIWKSSSLCRTLPMSRGRVRPEVGSARLVRLLDRFRIHVDVATTKLPNRSKAILRQAIRQMRERSAATHRS